MLCSNLVDSNIQTFQVLETWKVSFSGDGVGDQNSHSNAVNDISHKYPE